MTDTNNLLVSTQWLESQLGAEALCVIDVSIVIGRPVEGGVTFGPGRDEYIASHIPGAVFLDLQKDLSANHPDLVFMLPDRDAIAAGVAACGVNADSQVVLYNRGPSWWATRVWFMLEYIGFANAAVLDGGFDAWVAEDRPTEQGWVEASLGTVAATEGPENFVNKQDVIDVLKTADITLLNALSAEQHRGEVNPYGRPGHIPGSTNLPAVSVLDEAGRFKSVAALAELLPQPATATIHYCGGGISASFKIMLIFGVRD
jgi:thiosulfate/3-mercaptopyruvate sulfurtransferase